jgi:stress-induced morphogen
MSKKDDEINRQLIFNSGGANPEDYLTPKQLKRYKENPEKFIDIDVDLAMNEEAFDKEVSGENEIKRAYEKNRERLKETREESADPDRFQSQLETIKKGVEFVTPDPTNPKEVSEFLTDMAVDAGILGRSLGEDLPGGIALVISRRLTKNPSLQKMIKESTGLGIEPAQNLPADALPSTGLNIIKQIQEVFSGRLFGVTGGDFPAVPRKGFDPNITKKNLQLFDEIGFTGTNKLDIQDMLYGIDAEGKPLMSQYKRRVLKAGIGDETFNWSAFTQNRDEVVKDFLDGLQDLKIDPKTIHGHHISALRITSSLFDGLSPIQRKKLIKVFQREGLQLGNHPSNLLALHKSTHLDVVHPFLEQQVGKYGQLLLDPAKMKKLNPRQREGLVKKFAKIIKRSEEIAMENTQTWLSKTFENMSPQAAFDARMDMLNKVFDNDIAFREKLLKSVKSKEPLLPYQAEDIEIPDIPKAKKTRVTSKQTKFKNLVKKIKTENPNTKQMTIWDISDEALDAYRKLF